MAIFGLKPYVNPFRNMSIFSTFWTCCVFSLERPFLVLDYPKWHVPGLTLTLTLKNANFFELFKLLFFAPWKAFFRPRIS